jgi:DNA-binding NarL/FixJ family response regulator
MKRATVQIADDHLMFAEPAGRYLARYHDVLPPVTKLDEVSSALHSRHPDVLLLDIGFGKRSSLPLVSRLVKDHPATAVIMVTGFADGEMVATSLESGARGYVLKDDGPAELLLAIETVLAGKVYITPELRGPSPAQRYRLNRPLSDRQVDVLRLLRQGKTQQVIADELEVTLSTVEKHVLALKRRLGIDRISRVVDWKRLHIEGAAAERVKR